MNLKVSQSKGTQTSVCPKIYLPPRNQVIFFTISLSLSSPIRRYAGIPDFLTSDDMESMVRDKRIDPKMVFSYVQEVYRMCNEL